MSQKIRIPRTIKSAEKALADIGGLVTAKEWERAAIVAAFTRAENGRPPETGTNVPVSSTEVQSITEFASRGIRGLSSRPSVRRYRKAWETTGREVAPGKTVDLEGLPEWDSVFDATDSGGRPRAAITEIVKRVERDPKYAEHLTTEIAKVRPASSWTPTQKAETAKTLMREPEVAQAVSQDEVAHETTWTAIVTTDRERMVRERAERDTQRATRAPLPDEDTVPDPFPRAADTSLVNAQAGMGIILSLNVARHRIVEAMKTCQEIGISDDWRDDLLIHCERIQDAVGELRALAITGDQVQFDEALASLLEEGN